MSYFKRGIPGDGRRSAIVRFTLMVAATIAFDPTPLRAGEWLPPVNYSVPLPVTSVGNPAVAGGWSGWVPAAGAYNGYHGYVTVPQGQISTWQIFWDPTMGGTYNGSLAGLPPPRVSGFRAIPGGNTVNLYNYSAIANWAAQNWPGGMSVKAVYNNIANQLWTTGGNTPVADSGRLDFIWNIPKNTLYPAYMQGDDPQFYPQPGMPLRPFVPLWRYNPSYGFPNLGQESNIYNETNFPGCYITPSTIHGSDPAYTSTHRQGGTVFFDKWNSTDRGRWLNGVAQTGPSASPLCHNHGTALYWRRKVNHGWSRNLEDVRWQFNGVSQTIQFNNQSTAFAPNSRLTSRPSPPWLDATSGVPGSEANHLFQFGFQTPSEPFFYQVLGEAQFVIKLTDTGGINNAPLFTWDEGLITCLHHTNAAGNLVVQHTWDPNPNYTLKVGVTYWGGELIRIPRTPSLTLPPNPVNTPVTFDVPVAAYVPDTKPPVHLHDSISSGTFFPRAGHSLGETPNGEVPATLAMAVVDDNPYGNGNYTAAQVWPLGSPGSGAAGAPVGARYTGRMQPEIAYNVQRAYFGHTNLNVPFAEPFTKHADFLPGFPNGLIEPNSSSILFDEENFVWNTLTASEIQDLTGSAVGPYVQNGTSPGTAPSAPWGNGQNPAFCLGLYQVSSTALSEPLGVHFTQSPLSAAAPAWPAQTVSDHNRTNVPPVYTAWDSNIPRIHFAATDGSGNSTSVSGKGSPGSAVTAPPYLEDAAFNAKSSGQLPGGATYYAAVSQNSGASACNAAQCPPDKLGKSIFPGDIVSSLRPNVVLLIKDTKYNRTYIVNPQRQGIYGDDPYAARANRPAQPSFALPMSYPTSDPGTWAATLNHINTFPGSPGYPPVITPGLEPSNAVLGALLFGVPGDASTRPNPDEVNDPIEFADSSAPYQRQLGITDPSNPQYFRAYDRQNNVRHGIWIDQNTRLLFMPLAWTNSNPLRLIWLGPGVMQGSMRYSITDQAVSNRALTQADVAPDAEGGFEYIFRNPNCAAPTPPPTPPTQECSVTVTAIDEVQHTRSLKIQFFVSSTSMSVQNIEEKRIPNQ